MMSEDMTEFALLYASIHEKYTAMTEDAKEDEPDA